MSTRVVISGEAMIAGSRCTLLARSGSRQPTILEIMIVAISDSAITSASIGSSYWSRIRMPFVAARTAPTMSEMRNS